MLERITNPAELPEEQEFDNSLRPKTLSDFVGQDHIKPVLEIAIKAAKMRGDAMDHVLFYGPPGLGKTTLSNIIANELETEITVSSGPVLEKPADLAGVLTNLKGRNVFFIDEIHRLNRTIEEYIYPALEDFSIEIIVDQGPSARIFKINIEPFTMVGATTRAGLITAPLRARFGLTFRLDYYDLKSIEHIVRRSAKLIKIPLDEGGCSEIAKRSRGTPRVANRLLRRVRDYAQIKGDGAISQVLAQKALAMLNVDEHGLDDMDKRIIMTIIQNYGGGPIGLKTLSVAVGEDAGTIEEIYEPYLIQQGFIDRTLQGRCVTQKAYRFFKIKKSSDSQMEIF